MDILTTLSIMAICLVVEGFFSGSEIGVVSADRMKLRHAAAKGSTGARIALSMLERPEWLLSTTLVGTNIAVVTNTTMATALMIHLFGPNASWLAVVLVAPLIWVFGEIVPKSVFQQRADAMTPKAIFVLKFCSYLFYPILIVFTSLARLLSRLMGDISGQSPFTLREELQSMMEMSGDDGDIEPIEKTMIRRVFEFTETTAREVMVPLIDVAGIEQGATAAQAVRLATTRSHKTMPVYAERIDQIVGVLDTLELLGIDPEQPIRPFVKPVDYVPEAKGIKDLLVELRTVGQEMAVVVDEYGGAEGLITIEDILEEVVEDMQDEYDGNEVTSDWIRKLGECDYLVSARIDLDVLEQELGLELPEGNYASLSGFLLEKARDIPATGEVIDYKHISFTIQRATPRTIQEVRIRWKKN